MKIQISLFFLFCIFIGNSSLAQSKLVKERILVWDGNIADWRFDRLKTYEYDEGDTLRFVKTYFWEWQWTYPDLPFSHGLLYYEYDDRGNVIDITDYGNQIEPFIQHSASKSFNDDDCLEFESTLTPWGIDGPNLRTEYSYYNDCEIKSSVKYGYSYSNRNWYRTTKTEFAEKIGMTKSFDEFKWNNDLSEWELIAEGFNEYDSDGQILETFTKFENQLISESQTLWFYGDDGEYESARYFIKPQNGDWKLERTDTTHWDYNDQGQLIREARFRIPAFEATNINDNLTEIKQYEYFCDGSIRTLEREYSDNAVFEQTKSLFEYESEIRCPFEKETSEMTVFPIPASNFINISSPLLADSQTEISIISMTGIRHFFETTNLLTNYYSLDISDLVKGSYVLQLKNNELILTEKIILW